MLELTFGEQPGLLNLDNVGEQNMHGLKGKKQSPEHVAKRVLKLLGKPSYNKGKKMSEEQKLKISKAHMGMKHSEESKRKIKIARARQVITEETKQKLRTYTRIKRYNWKGKNCMVKKIPHYRNIHYWIQKELGKPNYCEYCNTTNIIKKFDWANISHEYKWNLLDWVRLCKGCHQLYDNEKLEQNVFD